MTASREKSDMTNCCVLVDDGNLCGEAPIWDARATKLYWVDCLSSKLFAFDWNTKARAVVLENFEVNGLALNEPGGFVLSNNAGVWLWGGTGDPLLIAAQVGDVKLQLNECVADSHGRLLTGTCFYTPSQTFPLGHLVSVGTDGSAQILDDGFHLANGLCFSPDSKILYFADSLERTIFAYSYDSLRGTVSNKAAFVKVDSNAGLPDGLTVDSEGFVWSAEWYGSCVKRYDPDGKLERRIVIPAKQVSSLAFGGPDLTEMFITSAAKSEPMPGMPPAYDASSGYFGGALFRINGDIRGRLEHKANISVATK